MQEFKGTPGPWAWSEDRFRDGFSGLYSGDDPVLWPQRENDGDDGAAWFGTDEDYYGETALLDADARLIAAAPDLLEALQKVVAISDRKHEAWDKAHAAIAKALNTDTTER